MKPTPDAWKTFQQNKLKPATATVLPKFGEGEVNYRGVEIKVNFSLLDHVDAD